MKKVFCLIVAIAVLFSLSADARSVRRTGVVKQPAKTIQPAPAKPAPVKKARPVATKRPDETKEIKNLKTCVEETYADASVGDKLISCTQYYTSLPTVDVYKMFLRSNAVALDLANIAIETGNGAIFNKWIMIQNNVWYPVKKKGFTEATITEVNDRIMQVYADQIEDLLDKIEDSNLYWYAWVVANEDDLEARSGYWNSESLLHETVHPIHPKYMLDISAMYIEKLSKGGLLGTNSQSDGDLPIIPRPGDCAGSGAAGMGTVVNDKGPMPGKGYAGYAPNPGDGSHPGKPAPPGLDDKPGMDPSIIGFGLPCWMAMQYKGGFAGQPGSAAQGGGVKQAPGGGKISFIGKSGNHKWTIASMKVTPVWGEKVETYQQVHYKAENDMGDTAEFTAGGFTDAELKDDYNRQVKELQDQVEASADKGDGYDDVETKINDPIDPSTLPKEPKGGSQGMTGYQGDGGGQDDDPCSGAAANGASGCLAGCMMANEQGGTIGGGDHGLVAGGGGSFAGLFTQGGGGGGDGGGTCYSGPTMMVHNRMRLWDPRPDMGKGMKLMQGNLAQQTLIENSSGKGFMNIGPASSSTQDKGYMNQLMNMFKGDSEDDH